MTQEATQVETVQAEVAPVVLPESPMPQAETIPEAVPQETSTPEQTDIQIYQDVLAQSQKDPGKFQMDDKQADAFLAVQDRIMSGEIKDPGLESPEEKPSLEEKSEQTDVNPEAETPQEQAPMETPEMSDSVADSLQKAMTKVGAKDVSELPAKVEGLINQMKSTGGKLGGEAKQLQVQVDQNNEFMRSLKDGNPQALAHFEKLTGHKLGTAVTPDGAKAQVDSSDIDMVSEDFLDDKLAPIVKNLLSEVKALKAQNEGLVEKDVSRDQSHQEAQAINGWVDDIVGLVADHPDDFGLNTSEARALAIAYWSKEGATNAIHPKFQGMHKLIEFSYESGMPDLKSAHVVMQHKNGNYAQKLIDATKTGAKEAQHTIAPNAAISSKQGRVKSDVPQPDVTEDMVTAMEKGNLNAIPQSVLESWSDDAGNFVKSKVPDRFHKAAFG